jgi:glycosyltransferase A (GT-A) superfamily protein (DUF2064 family)
MSIKSNDAKQLLENALFNQAFANVRENIVAQIEYCPLDDDSLRNQLMLSLQLLIQIRGDIENEINNGLLEGE